MTATPVWNRWRNDLEALSRAALAAADPANAVRRHLHVEDRIVAAGTRTIDLAPATRLRLIAFGKASLAMTRAALERLGNRLERGVVSYPRNLSLGSDWPATLSFFPASHPLPDDGSLAAGDAAIELVGDLGRDDLVLVLASGGGSALIESLRPGVGLADLQKLTNALQRSGADIIELNTVRRCLSRFKGGGLLRAAHPANVLTLLLSDVIGDRLEAIASGPTVPSSTGPAEALEVLERRGLTSEFAALANTLRDAKNTANRPAAGSDVEPRATHVIVGSNRMAAAAAQAEARRRGFQAIVLTDRLQGEARVVGRRIGGLAQSVRVADRPSPVCLILGGETTVTVRGQGRGGRNQETALGAALSLDGCAHAALLSFGTDGIDGPTGAAGAFATGETLARATRLGLSPHAALADNDAEPFFRALDDLWNTGPTGTNVNDLVIVTIYP